MGPEAPSRLLRRRYAVRGHERGELPSGESLARGPGPRITWATAGAAQLAGRSGSLRRPCCPQSYKHHASRAKFARTQTATRLVPILTADLRKLGARWLSQGRPNVVSREAFGFACFARGQARE